MIRLESPDGRSSISINPIGAALSELWFGDVQIAGSPDRYSGVTLFPWPNRIHGGTWQNQGVVNRLAVNDVERGAALHGLVFRETFEWMHDQENRCDLRLNFSPTEGYPFQAQVRVSFALGNGALEITQEVVNDGVQPMPFAMGVHPYFLADPKSRFESKDRTFTLGSEHVDETLGPNLHSATFRTESYALEIEARDTEYLHIFTNRYSNPEFIWFAIEPQTSPADSLNNGVGVSVLDVGESKSFNYRLHWR